MCAGTPARRGRITRDLMTLPSSIVLLALLAAPLAYPQSDWAYGGNAEGTRYSPLKQINRSNASKLQVAWTYDISAPGGSGGGSQTQPIVVNGVVYGNTPGGHVIALNAATGKASGHSIPKAPASESAATPSGPPARTAASSPASAATSTRSTPRPASRSSLRHTMAASISVRTSAAIPTSSPSSSPRPASSTRTC